MQRAMVTQPPSSCLIAPPPSNLANSSGVATAGGTKSPSPSPSVVNGVSAKSGDDRPICKHCKKPVEQVHYESHVSHCLETKAENARKKKERKEAKVREAAAKAKEKEKQQAADKDKDKDGDSVMGGTAPAASQEDADKAADAPSSAVTSTSTKKPPSKSATKASQADGSSKKTKKRKADTEGNDNKEPKKKKLKKDEPPKPKLPKPKGPVNVEIQCGVPLDKEKGGYCARSLTCKSHSMGLKRAVPGRSLPYDQLLAMYQKKNQAKQQKALMEAQVGSAAVDDDAEGGVVDSEEERESVMKALGRWRPRPLEQVTTVPMRRRYGYVRIKEMLGNALAGGWLGKLFGPPPVGPVIGSEAVLDGVELVEAPSRKASTAGAAGGGGGGSAGGTGGVGGAGAGAGHAHPVPKGVAVPVRKGSVASSVGAA